MSDYQLQQEHLDIQYQIRIAESESSSMAGYQSQRPTSYTATTYGNTTRITPDRGVANAFNAGLQRSRQRRVTELLSRQRELGMEMYGRGISSP